MKRYMLAFSMTIFLLAGCISDEYLPEQVDILLTDDSQHVLTADTDHVSAVIDYLEGLGGYPKVFQAWSPAENIEHLSMIEQLALHDLVFHGPYILDVRWNTSDNQPYEMLATELVDMYTGEANLSEAKKMKAELLDLNPDFTILCEIMVREANYVNPDDITNETPYWEKGHLPADSNLWIRDEYGQLVPSWGEDVDANGVVEAAEASACLMDFTNPDVQDLIVEKAIAIKNSGVFDGVFIDWWSESHQTLVNLDYTESYKTLEIEEEARIQLLDKIRQAVGEEFLILVNTNFDPVPRSALYINGIYMECYKDWNQQGYTEAEMDRVLETLIWAESSLQEPVINCLEGWRNTLDYDGDKQTRLEERESIDNLRWMRGFTALSLTCSDGYVLFSDSNEMPTPDHLHNYYEFWTYNLGQPISPKYSIYEDYENVYYRYFDHGLVFYNGSNESVKLELSESFYVDGNLVSQVELNAYDGEILIDILE